MESFEITDRDGITTALMPAPCPFCASDQLRVVSWYDDSGDYDAIECRQCLGRAPATTWNLRAVRA